MATTVSERKLLVAGEWVETGEWIEVRSPYSGDVVGRVAKGGAAEARACARRRRARRCASRCPPTSAPRSWTSRPGCSDERQEEAAQIDLRRGGQAAEGRAGRGAARGVHLHVRRRRGAQARRARWCRWTPRPAGAGKLAFTLRLPIGIVGAISPFNFPLNLVAHKIAPALAAGCAVVLKPASTTPLSALFLAEPRGGSGPAAGLAQRRRRPRPGRSATCSSRTSA